MQPWLGGADYAVPAGVDVRACLVQGPRDQQAIGLQILETLVTSAAQLQARSVLSRVLWTEFRDVALPNILQRALELLLYMRKVLYKGTDTGVCGRHWLAEIGSGGCSDGA